MEEEEYYEPESRVPAWVKYTAGVTGFIAIMCLFVWVTVPAPPPELAPMIRVSSLAHNKQLTPGSDRRIILIGDVHGMHKEFRQVLDEAKFNPKTDQLILLGDFTSKGPDSLSVIDDAIKYGAACVRGNHEDDILRFYAARRGIHNPVTYPPNALKAPATFGATPKATIDATTGSKYPWPEPTDPAEPTNAAPEPTHLNSPFDVSEIDQTRDKTLAMMLTPRHVRYIESCPAILKLGQVKSNGGKGVAVHGGLMWNETDLENQRPEVIFELRSLLPPNLTTPSDEDGIPWAREWNAIQKQQDDLQSRLTVFYGHDASRGLKLRKYTKGLDSRCVRGGDLSAMVLSMNKRGKVRSTVISVKCPDVDDERKAKGFEELEVDDDNDEFDQEHQLDEYAALFDQFLGLSDA